MQDMTAEDLRGFYLGYIDCLNRRNWAALGGFVHAKAAHSGSRIGLSGYREMLEGDVATIPDLFFDVRRSCATDRSSPAASISTASRSGGCLACR